MHPQFSTYRQQVAATPDREPARHGWSVMRIPHRVIVRFAPHDNGRAREDRSVEASTAALHGGFARSTKNGQAPRLTPRTARR